MSKIPRAPAAPPATSPSDPRYFDARDLETEMRRTFQICHECRMCVNYCGSFPELFRRVDRDIDSGRAEGAELLDDKDFAAIGDECWQCKLCYIKCPYTKDDEAGELLDFPRLMGREKAVRARRNGVTLVDRVLGEPQLIGTMGAGVMSPVANLVNANRLVRKVQEKVAGISSEFPLPPMAKETFSSWCGARAKKDAAKTTGEAGEVVLFATCYGEYNAPHVAIAAVKVLEHNGLRVLMPGELPNQPAAAKSTCCGMPNLDGGDIAAAAAKIRANVALLYPQAQAGLKIVVPSPTCGYTMKKEWAEIVPEPEVRAVAAATVDLMEFLVSLGREKKLKLEFKKGLGQVAYHAACHLRAQKIGFPGARVLGKIPDTDVRVIEECSAVDGTWGMKAAHFEKGRKYAQRLARGIREAEPDVVVADCTLSALRIDDESKRGAGGSDTELPRIMHPIEALAEAYGLGDAASTSGITPAGTYAEGPHQLSEGGGAP
jgi:glycerol-3-phosphate dehydrogenase subunit C